MTHRRWPLVVACLVLGLFAGVVVSQKLVGQPVAPEVGKLPGLPRDWMSYGPIVKRVLPAVVSVEVQGRDAARPRFGEVDPGFGSGVLIDASGVVLTNHHVVSGADAVEVTLLDGRKYSTRDIRSDPKSDLAILNLSSKEALPRLEFGDSDAMEVGDRVLAFGAPFGLTGSVTQGIVSAKSRQNLNLNFLEDFLQIDAAVNPGNSGGPVVNMEGKVVGLTSAIKTRTGGFQGVGLAVSSKLARNVAVQLIKHGGVRRPYFGILVRDLDDVTAASQKLKPNGGVIVTSVVPGSPGESANIGVGDIITSINEQSVTSTREMQKVVLGLPVGKEVAVLVVRNGTLFRTSAVATEQPDIPRPGQGVKSPILRTIDFESVGVAVTEISSDLANRLGLSKEVKGVIVTGVTGGGLADQSGIARGTVILQVDRTPLATAEEFRKAVSQAPREKGAVLHVLRQNGNVDYVILKGQ